MADLVQSTLVPKEQNPCLSGGLIDIKAMSRLRIFCRNKLGISQRNIGMASARPSDIAFLVLPPTKRELDLNIPESINEKSIIMFVQFSFYTMSCI